MSIIREKHKKKKVSKVIIAIIAVIVAGNLFFVTVLGGVAVFAFNALNSFIEDLPRLEDFTPTETALTSRIYAADGTLIATYHGEENRILVSYEQIPQNLINAVIAIEDERFYQHKGFDVEGIIRSFIINMISGEIEQGATTITQGYVKNVYMPEEKYEISYERKIKEIVLAYQIEQIYSKEEILEMYLNTVYFGEGAYGVQAAAKAYFNKDVEYLSLPECAMLAGLLKTYLYSPYIDKKAALERRNTVLAKMLELEYISQDEYEAAINTPIITQRPVEEVEKGFAPYFVDYVKQEIIEEFGVEKALKGGYEIYTTLDPEMQTAAENAIKEVLPDAEDPSAALVAMDPSNGYIKAMVGGKEEDYTGMGYNLVTQSHRQPGSTFKVFALISALEQGISPYMTFNPNGTVVFDIAGSAPWEVQNYNNQQYDTNEMTIFEATVKSVNVVYSQLIMKVGAYHMAQLANNMGIETPMEPLPSMGLGAQEVCPLEVCSAFCTIADYGVRHYPVAIVKVTDKDGNVLKDIENNPEEGMEGTQVISPINAYRAIEILQQVVQRGTGTRARLDDRPCAGKTGTTDKAENAWFTGFTTNLAACVWMGHPEANIRMTTIHDLRVQGGAHPAMIWKLFMSEATKKLPAENFSRPADDMINIQVVANPETGELMVPNRFTPPDQIIMKEFHYGQEPTTQVPIGPEDIPIMPMVALMPKDEANHILVQSGYTHIKYINEPYSEVPPGYTHRQDPMWGQPVETIRKIKVWVNP
ncbi:MAG: PBP1A family penicillin-binding protein [Actinomycetota bacterium]|nr:PBP1A family penicillin-binding protein [Actinomycetota bacterium]